LLSLATERHILNGGALAFGEGNIKRRIKNVLNYRKFPLWVIIVSVIIVIAAGIALATNPKPEEPVEQKENEKNLVESPLGTKVQIEFLSDNMALSPQTSLRQTIQKYLHSLIQHLETA